MDPLEALGGEFEVGPPRGPIATQTRGIIRPETGPGALPSAALEPATAHQMTGGGLSAKAETALEQPGGFEAGMIGQRLPSKITAPAAERTVDIEAMKASPRSTTQSKAGVKTYFDRALDLFKNYSTTPVQWGALDPHTFSSALVTQMKNNLLWLHDQYQWKDRAAHWYDGGHQIVSRQAQRYDLAREASAGTYAALSPQKDWFENVSLGDRVLETVMDPQIRSVKTSPEMQQTFARLTQEGGNPELAKFFPAIAEKSYDEITALPMDPAKKAFLQAAWIRLYDQTYRSPNFHVITPEGEYGPLATNADGTPAVVRWQTLKMIGNAVRMIDSNGRDAETVLGGKHKVRNFYNNLLNPGDASSVTIDTHAVAAAHLQPFGGSDLEVAHNFANDPPRDPVTNQRLGPPAPESDVTGMRGTYAMYAEAYRQAAAERGILPRQMQSITWEASRGLFTNKSKKQKAIINELWQRYRRGQATIEQTRDAVLQASGGINPPEWAGSAAGVNAGTGHPANPGELPEPQLYGPGAATAFGGGGGGAAAAIPPDLETALGAGAQ
jgi:hypothetical protein